MFSNDVELQFNRIQNGLAKKIVGQESTNGNFESDENNINNDSEPKEIVWAEIEKGNVEAVPSWSLGNTFFTCYVFTIFTICLPGSCNV